MLSGAILLCTGVTEGEDGIGTLSTDIMSTTLGLAVVGILVGAGAWDVYLWVSRSPGQTVSHVIGQWGAEFPPALIALGVLLGHLFWPVGPRAQ